MGGSLRVDINSSTAGELDTVPCLKGHAFEIVRYREERGRFTKLRQLDEVPGLAGKIDLNAELLLLEPRVTAQLTRTPSSSSLKS